MSRLVKVGFFVSLFLNVIFLWNNPAMGIGEEEVARLIVGETKIISTRSPTRVIVGNPQVADVGEVTNSEINISAKAPGVTTLVFWDAFGEQSVKIKVFAEDMQEIKNRTDNLLASLGLPDVYTQLAEDEGKILLLGTVKTAQDRERVATALGPLAEKTVDLVKIKEEEAAVDIDVQILELDRDATETLGFTWPGTIGVTERGSTGVASTGAKWSTLFKVLNLQRTTGTATDITANPFAIKLDMLIQQGKVRILSRPRLACQSGKEAELLVGGEKPVFTTAVQSTIGSSTSVEYKEYGIKLKIKPTVAAEERIKLALDVSVSDIGEAETIGATAAPTAKAYPLTKRTASTELFLNDGQTLAIGGLIKQKTEEDLRKFPWLADVPILGLFFRQKVTKVGGGQGTRGNTELFITLTPQIIRPEKEFGKGQKSITPAKIIAPKIPEESLNDPVARYASIVQRRILDNLTYPLSAKEAGFQGAVKLSLRFSYRGELLEAIVKDSSGYNVLDDNAVSAAKNISSYPPFPSAIDQKELWIDIPVVYQLD